MGRTVMAVVGVAAAVAIAVAAPMLAPAFMVAAVGSSTAIAITGAALSVALAVGMRMIFSGPVKGPWGRPVPLPPKDSMAPVNLPWAYRILAWYMGFWHRFSFTRLTGDCMPLLGNRKWALIDRRATIRRGDLFGFSESTWTLGTYLQAPGGRLKRFLGCNPVTGTFDWQMDNPPEHHCDRVQSLEWAFRIRFAGPTLLSVLKARWQIWRDPSAHDERLAQ